MTKPRVIAYYLPQFHPIAENNAWWGDGFTEWTNVKKAIPLFEGHDQPRIPDSDLGYYDLRDPQIRQKQADLAKASGIEAFCYWHYWFGNGKQLLEKIFNEVLATGKPEFPFCLAWANHSWLHNKFSTEGSAQVIVKQEYPGIHDHILHFNTLLKAFQDHRYVKVEGKPVFVIYRAFEMPDLVEFMNKWQELAIVNGLPGMHFIAITYKLNEIQTLLSLGFQGVNIIRLFHFINHFNLFKRKFVLWQKQYFKRGLIVDYSFCKPYFQGVEDSFSTVYPSLFPNWDHSPRSGRRDHILTKSNPALFQEHVHKVFELVRTKEQQHQLVFLKSWNEWAEGNFIEPDVEYGKGYLEAIKKEIENE